MAMTRFVGTRGSGFDEGTDPPWLAVSALPPLNIFTAKEVDLMDGAGWTLTAEHPAIVDVTENPTVPGPGRRINVFGMSRGITHVLGTPPGGLPPVRLLEVEVKKKRRLPIAFHVVVDSHFNKTTRSAVPNFMSQLRTNTNIIFEGQANLVLDSVREKEITVRTSLRDIIGKQNRGELGFTGDLRGPYHEWFKLVDEGERRAEINVFFVPRSILDRENTYPPLVFGQDGNIVIEDDPAGRMDRVERELAHWIAYMLGCSRTTSKGRADHLMSRSGTATARFLPKNDANVLNPTL